MAKRNLSYMWDKFLYPICRIILSNIGKYIKIREIFDKFLG